MMLFSDENAELYDRENQLGDLGDNFYDHGENKPPTVPQQATPGSSSIDPFGDSKDSTHLLDSDSQFSKEFFEFFSTVGGPQIGSRSPGTLKAPLMTRSNSNSSTFEGLPARQPRTMSPIMSAAQKHLLQREDSLNEILSVIKNDEKTASRPQNLNLQKNFGGERAQDIAGWLDYLTHSAQSSPVGEEPRLPLAFPRPTTQHDNGQQSSADDPQHSGPSNALPPPDTHHTYTANSDNVPILEEIKSPEPTSNYSWNINGISVKLEPKDAEKPAEVNMNLIYASDQEPRSRPASAFPSLQQAEHPPRPFSVTSLPPDVAVMSPRSSFVQDPEDASPRSTTRGRRIAAAPVRKRKIKTEPDYRDSESPMLMDMELPPPRKYSRRKPLDKEDPENFSEWRKKRDRNNDAVRRARAKKRYQDQILQQKCEALDAEVDRLRSLYETEHKLRIHLEELLKKSEAAKKSAK